MLILYQGSRLFSRGGCPTFSRGEVQMINSIETHIRTCYFSGGGGVQRTLYPPLNPHMCNVIIMGQYLSQSRF